MTTCQTATPNRVQVDVVLLALGTVLLAGWTALIWCLCLIAETLLRSDYTSADLIQANNAPLTVLGLVAVFPWAMMLIGSRRVTSRCFTAAAILVSATPVVWTITHHSATFS